ncbi:MAG: prepilin-type N-terminal cleavage/methylation domain-containing protein [Candidatus Paceibacterota bacterium]
MIVENFSHKKGFTLIELMVVISIISLLSSIVLTSLNTARVRARDARRMSDITELRNALQLIANDNGGIYPPSTYWGINCIGLNDGDSNCWLGNGRNMGDTNITTLFSNYMKVIPRDPSRTPAPGVVGDYYSYANNSFYNNTGNYASGVWTPIATGPILLWVPENLTALDDKQCLGLGQAVSCGNLLDCGVLACALHVELQ